MLLIDIVHASSEQAASTLAASESAQEGLLATFGLDPKLFLFQLINFIIVGVILWFMILKPLVKKLAERQRLIDESLENAKKVQQTLERGEQDYQKRLLQARHEANKILEQAGLDAESLSEEMRAKAKKEIENLVAQAKRGIQHEKEAMVAGLKNEMANFVVLALEKILSEKIGSEHDKKLIAEVIKNLEHEKKH